MACRVVKWIKGRPYLYEQTSYRVGGRVHTESRYLGPAGGGNRSQIATVFAMPQELPALPALAATPPGDACDKDARSDMPQGVNHANSPETPPRGDDVPHAARVRQCLRPPAAVNLTKRPRPPFKVSANLSRHRISERGLEREHALAGRRLARLGIDPASMPAITVRHGGRVGFRRRLLSRNYVVTLPRFERGNRTAFKEAFSAALARATLDTIKAQAPDRYTALAVDLDDAFRETTVNLTKYMLATAAPLRLAAVIKLRWLGCFMPIAGGKVDAQTVGMIAYGRRKTWEDEAVAILAAVQRKGFAGVTAERLAEYGKARAEEASAAADWKALPRFSYRRNAARRRYRRAAARLQANALMLRKLHTLGTVLDFSHGAEP